MDTKLFVRCYYKNKVTLLSTIGTIGSLLQITDYQNLTIPQLIGYAIAATIGSILLEKTEFGFSTYDHYQFTRKQIELNNLDQIQQQEKWYCYKVSRKMIKKDYGI